MFSYIEITEKYEECFYNSIPTQRFLLFYFIHFREKMSINYRIGMFHECEEFIQFRMIHDNFKSWERN